MLVVLGAKPFECKIRADLGFIVDGSEDVGDVALAKEKDFVNAVVASFGISDDGTRAGVIAGGEAPNLAIKMNAHGDLSSLKAEIAKIRKAGDNMRVDKALLLAYDELFSASNGARDSVPQVLTLLTTAARLEKAEGDSLYLASSRFHEAGIKVLVLVVGKDADKDKLSKITTNVEDIFYVEKFDELAATSLRESIAKSACKASGRCKLHRFI